MYCKKHIIGSNWVYPSWVLGKVFMLKKMKAKRIVSDTCSYLVGTYL